MNWFQSLMVRMFGDQDPITPVPPSPPPVSWPTTDPVVVLAATAWMEDDVGGKVGMQAVINVVMNRVQNPRWWGTSVFTVCMKPLQFSCWNKGSANIPRFETMLKNPDANWGIARGLATLAMQGLLEDITDNSDSYYSASMKMPPAWSADWTRVGNFGGNIFGRLYLQPRPSLEAQSTS